ncbi:hypothetical protein IJ670_07670 [bacterium]|nr:hypothetical protein [bacterium]
MQQVQNVNFDKTSGKVGYKVPTKEEKRENFYKTESHLYKQRPLTGLQVGAHKFTNSLLTYFPKGFAGSKNSNFYEYLSMSMVPYVLGSITMALLYGANNKKYLSSQNKFASREFKAVTAGVIFYAIGKWLSPKLTNLAIKPSTGINLDEKYLNRTHELPELGQEEGMSRVEYPGVFDSVQFYRKDLRAKDGELNHDSIYYHDDIVVKKAGYKGAKDASTNQLADEKIRSVKARTTALESFSKYVMAALGVAYGFQDSFRNLTLKHANTIPKKLLTVGKALVGAAKELWKGTDRNILTKHAGKVLVIGSALSTLAAWLIPTAKFKDKPETMKAKVDPNKECEVA